MEWVRDIRGMRFELSDSLVEEGAGSRQQAELDICKILDVDGEAIALSAPKFDVRYCSTLSLSLSHISIHFSFQYIIRPLHEFGSHHLVRLQQQQEQCDPFLTVYAVL